MTLPKPQPALVIRYSYLWNEAHLSGQEEGVKDRPCAVLLTVQEAQTKESVIVLPITHSPPKNPTDAIEIPLATKRRLGLDEAPSWVVLTEANRFFWPGPDLRPILKGDMSSVVYGFLPYTFFEAIRLAFLEKLKAREASLVSRTD